MHDAGPLTPGRRIDSPAHLAELLVTGLPLVVDAGPQPVVECGDRDAHGAANLDEWQPGIFAQLLDRVFAQPERCGRLVVC